MPNTQWRIACGDYDFAIDRQTLAYSLTETKTGTVWADSLSTGWIELEERETGVRTRYNFADAKLISVAEKSSHQGKRILFGLDLLGIPIDLYFICSEKEIQLTVEANRDTKTYKVQDVGLLHGLVSVPDDGASYLVVPVWTGVLIRAQDAPVVPQSFGIWHHHTIASDSATMPFVGAVLCGTADLREQQSALTLITDSAYGRFTLKNEAQNKAFIDTEYQRDPERRRLDLRIQVLPLGDHIAIARAYREKIIGDRNHVTLRKKMRNRPVVRDFAGIAYFFGVATTAYFIERSKTLPTTQLLKADFDIDRIVFLGNLHDKFELEATACLDDSGLDYSENRWESIDSSMEQAKQKQDEGNIVFRSWDGDWSAISTDVASVGMKWVGRTETEFVSVPLAATVYHDSLIMPEVIRSWKKPRFLTMLRNLAPPLYVDAPVLPPPIQFGPQDRTTWIRQTYAVLGPLNALTFTTFLTEHRFLTADMQVEEAVYSDKTHILINKSEADTFERDDVALPAGGFYVRHAQMEAHYALRVGDVTFDKPAWRIRRSQDGRPLETSDDIIVQEFPV